MIENRPVEQETDHLADDSLVIEPRPDSADAHNDRAFARYALKEYEKAWDDTRTCRRLGKEPHPDFVKSLSQASGRSE